VVSRGRKDQCRGRCRLRGEGEAFARGEVETKRGKGRGGEREKRDSEEIRDDSGACRWRGDNCKRNFLRTAARRRIEVETHPARTTRKR